MIDKRLNVTKLLNGNFFYKRTFYDEEREKVTKCEYCEHPNFLMIIAGCSGSGKTTFESILTQYYPKYFNKLPQVTTRAKRNDEDNGYYFVNKEIYEYMHDTLIARLGNFNSNQYGTIPVFDKNKINTVIASYDAIDDLFELINSDTLFIIPIFILFDIKDGNITENGMRVNRDASFLEKERKELYNVYEKYKDQCIYTAIYKYEDYYKYAEPCDIFEF